MTPDRYSRTAFQPSDIGYGPVTVLDADGHVVRRIDTKTLSALDSARDLQESPKVAHRTAYRSLAKRRKQTRAA